MRFNVLNRKLHYWISAAVALPLLLTVTTGLMLQLKKHWTWVQPPEQRGTVSAQPVELAEILRTLIADPRLAVRGWDDIERIDLRPGKGLAKVRLRDSREAQIDLGSGEILQLAERRSDWIESIHDGSIFGEAVKLGLFLPAGAALLFLLLSGLWMFALPLLPRRLRMAGRSRPARTASAPLS